MTADALERLIAKWRREASREVQENEFLTQPGSVLNLCADELEALVRAGGVDLHAAASERDAIATLLSDRSEPGTYAKVEGLLNESRTGGVERTPEGSRLDRMAIWNDRLELAVYGKVGNTFEQHQADRIGAFIDRIVDLEARGAVEKPAPEPLKRMDELVDAVCSRLRGELPSDPADQRYRQGMLDIRVFQERADKILRSARPSPPPVGEDE